MMDFLAKYGSMIVHPVFMAVFFGFGYWAYKPSNKKQMEAFGDIPLKESRDGNE